MEKKDPAIRALETTLKLLRGLYGRNFWGSVEIKFEDGKPVHVKMTENIKP